MDNDADLAGVSRVNDHIVCVSVLLYCPARAHARLKISVHVKERNDSIWPATSYMQLRAGRPSWTEVALDVLLTCISDKLSLIHF